MFLGEPPASQADLHFRMFGIPVRVHPFFWIVTLLMGLGGRADPLRTLIWVAVVFVSVLLHELGHASIQMFYGGHPWITLYSFGGLASCNDGPRTPWRRILVLLAGPGAGFLFAAVVIAGLRLSGHLVGFGKFDTLMNANWLFLNPVIQPLGPLAVFFAPVKAEMLNEVIAKVLEVNIMWGVINLLPVFPLDGGQIARELFNLQNPHGGAVQALQLSAGIAVLIAAYALLNHQFYPALLFGYLAYANFQSLQFQQNRWR